MRAWRRLACALATVGFGAAQLGGCSSEADPDGCTLIGCGAAVTVWLPHSGDLSTLDGATAEFCRNQVCFTGQGERILSEVNPSVSFTMTSTASGEAAARAGHVSAYTVSPEPVVIYFEYTPGAVEDLVDGDRYTIELTGPVPQSFLGNVSAYHVSHPNGPACEPTCKSFEFDTR